MFYLTTKRPWARLSPLLQGLTGLVLIRADLFASDTSHKCMAVKAWEKTGTRFLISCTKRHRKALVNFLHYWKCFQGVKIPKAQIYITYETKKMQTDRRITGFTTILPWHFLKPPHSDKQAANTAVSPRRKRRFFRAINTRENKTHLT